MDFLQKMSECKPEEVDSIVKEAIKAADANATKVERIGFENGLSKNSVFKGFIPLNTRIKYSNLGLADYGMQTTDFIYEFMHFIKDKQIYQKKILIDALEPFVIDYFGLPGKMSRDTIFNDIPFQNAKNNDEYFAALENNKLGDLKGKDAAQCTERSALVQQILSILGMESYYCFGCADINGQQEPHCFNIVKRKKDYALLDYSVTVNLYKDDNKERYRPFIGLLTNEEFSDFINKGNIKSFDDYDIVNGEQKKKGTRMYVVGKYEIEKENVNIESDKIMTK